VGDGSDFDPPDAAGKSLVLSPKMRHLLDFQTDIWSKVVSQARFHLPHENLVKFWNLPKLARQVLYESHSPLDKNKKRILIGMINIFANPRENDGSTQMENLNQHAIKLTGSN
jgi:hypothetical protein